MPNIESYCIFADKPKFMPMFNPKTMLEYGIHEGIVFSTVHGRPLESSWVDKGLKLPYHKLSVLPDVNLNYYKTMEEDLPSHLIHDKVTNSFDWFQWYLRFYYDKLRTPDDDVFIQHWIGVVTWAFQKDTKVSAKLDQLLLHYSWNPGYFPTVLGMKE